MTLEQTAPGLSDETMRWVTNNGLAVVFLLLFFSLFAWLIRIVIGQLAKQITEAIQYFTGKLDGMAERQEKSLDRLDDRLSAMTNSHSDSSTRLAEALSAIADSQRQQAAALAALNESNRILLTFMTQNMANIQAHRAVVEPVITGDDGPPVGVIKHVEEG